MFGEMPGWDLIVNISTMQMTHSNRFCPYADAQGAELCRALGPGGLPLDELHVRQVVYRYVETSSQNYSSEAERLVKLLQSPLDPDSLYSCYTSLDSLIVTSSDVALTEILAFCDLGDGACLPFSAALFHPRPEIQKYSARIIHRLIVAKLGPDKVNPYIKSAIASILGQEVIKAKNVSRVFADVLEGSDSSLGDIDVERQLPEVPHLTL